MSRFKPLKAQSSGPSPVSVAINPVSAPAPLLSPSPAQAPPAAMRPLPPGPQPSLFQTLGFVTLIAFFMSGQLNDWAIRFFGTKAYLSTVAIVALPVILLTCAVPAVRTLQNRIAILWALFLIWMVVCTPTSVWKGGTVTFLINYIPRNYMMFFYCATFLVTVRQIRTLYLWLAAQGMIVLTACWAFGSSSVDNRFHVPDSMFFTNSNEVALALLISATQFMFLAYGRNMIGRVIGVIGILGCVFFILQTGSRGCAGALVVLMVVVIWSSPRKLTALAVAVPILVAPLLIRPSAVFHRLMVVGLDDEEIQGRDDLAAIASQQQRAQLFRRSLLQTVHHPIFGVGPNQFAVAENAPKAARGEWAPWLGTHNSYTQVSSECGVPGILLYLGVLGVALRTSYRIYKSSRGDPRTGDIPRLAFCLFCGLVVNTVGSTFFHMAYTSGLPVLAGTTLALWNASKDQLQALGLVRA